MKNLIFLSLLFFTQIVYSQSFDSSVVKNDIEVSRLFDKLNKSNIKSGKVSKEDSKIYKEIGRVLNKKGKYDEADYFLSKSKGYTEIVEVESVRPEVVFEQPKEDQTDSKFVENLPKSYDNISKDDMKKLATMLDSKIQTLLKEKEELLSQKASQEVIEMKDGTIKVLKKEKQIVDLSIQKDDLILESNGLKIEKGKLKNYLIWSIISISVLILVLLVLLQRKTIKVQDKEIEDQLKDINKKNTYLEHAARIIRHDMHSGINTYMPRGLSSLEKRLSNDDIQNLKIDGSIKMIKEGLSHTQKVYKSVYEFTNLVKQNVVLHKEIVNIKDLLSNYLSNTAYKSQVEIDELGELQVNQTLFCNAIDNLIKNGLKYNDSQEKLVKVYLENDNIVIQDNGRGLSEKQFNKILNSVKKENIENEESGLGLNICSAILTEHGFNLSCEKNNIGTKIKINIKK